MQYDLNALVNHATHLEQQGLFRRALRLWQEIATRPDASDELRERAWTQITGTVGDRAAAGGEPHADPLPRPNRKYLVAEDKKRIMAYFAMGYSSATICGLTGRSRSFVATCRKNATS
ncbi:hypothetical protein [Shimwellia blattae]|uniref:PerC family transcriptional regulator n=1 Tax=Shimwellia blattae (strain ATCC 29907 / DSM 4481 / JCM 1650 / NBRC 105725 / CDC 9005-74) TaxID=630626 RepID=I2BDS3_SHIBC|nr:hypothetical protein [Shimwellia blattae]AFJ48677.1 hypothetical protein EBL_c36260 [Shimwellia blattae DSM 4481 = NBRC 105725]GAB81288.1 hypothetical protein EB105725_13_00220 [Shimwellia blattae DSM 4481 = NBRC 105725]VDY66166.1 Uncharacterised protein [Shimwellia blattae]VEC27178.1 Uncharacterised protein [Shimwellia blattae]